PQHQERPHIIVPCQYEKPYGCGCNCRSDDRQYMILHDVECRNAVNLRRFNQRLRYITHGLGQHEYADRIRKLRQYDTRHAVYQVKLRYDQVIRYHRYREWDEYRTDQQEIGGPFEFEMKIGQSKSGQKRCNHFKCSDYTCNNECVQCNTE